MRTGSPNHRKRNARGSNQRALSRKAHRRSSLARCRWSTTPAGAVRIQSFPHDRPAREVRSAKSVLQPICAASGSRPRANSARDQARRLDRSSRLQRDRSIITRRTEASPITALATAPAVELVPRRSRTERCGSIGGPHRPVHLPRPGGCHPRSRARMANFRRESARRSYRSKQARSSRSPSVTRVWRCSGAPRLPPMTRQRGAFLSRRPCSRAVGLGPHGQSLTRASPAPVSSVARKETLRGARS